MDNYDKSDFNRSKYNKGFINVNGIDKPVQKMTIRNKSGNIKINKVFSGLLPENKNILDNAFTEGCDEHIHDNKLYQKAFDIIFGNIDKEAGEKWIIDNYPQFNCEKCYKKHIIRRSNRSSNMNSFNSIYKTAMLFKRNDSRSVSFGSDHNRGWRRYKDRKEQHSKRRKRKAYITSELREPTI